MTLTANDGSSFWLLGGSSGAASSSSSSSPSMISREGEMANGYGYPSTSYGFHHTPLSAPLNNNNQQIGNHAASASFDITANVAEPSLNPNFLRYNAECPANVPHNSTGTPSYHHSGNGILQQSAVAGGGAKSAMEEIQRLLVQQQQAGHSDAARINHHHEAHFNPASLALYSPSSSAEHSALHSPLTSVVGLHSVPAVSWHGRGADMRSSPQFAHYQPNALSAGSHDGMATLAGMPMMAAHHITGSPLSSNMSMFTDSGRSSPYPSSSLSTMIGNASALAHHPGTSSMVAPLAFSNDVQPGIPTLEEAKGKSTSSASSANRVKPVAARNSTIGGSIAGSTRRAKFQRSRTGCMVCRKRKVRCDQDGVPCKQCRIGKRDCHYEDNPPKRKRKGKAATATAKALLAGNDAGIVEVSGEHSRNSSYEPLDGSDNKSGEEGSRTSSSPSARADSSTAKNPSNVQQPSKAFAIVNNVDAGMCTAARSVPRTESGSSNINAPLTTALEQNDKNYSQATPERWTSTNMSTNFGALFNGDGSEEWMITTPSTGPTSVHTADGDGIDSSASSRRVTLTLEGHLDSIAKGDPNGIDAVPEPATRDAYDASATIVSPALTTSLIDASHYAVAPKPS